MTKWPSVNWIWLSENKSWLSENKSWPSENKRKSRKVTNGQSENKKKNQEKWPRGWLKIKVGRVKIKVGTFFSFTRTLLPAVPLSPPPACAHFLMTTFDSIIIIISSSSSNSKPTFFALPNIPNPLRTLRRANWRKFIKTAKLHLPPWDVWDTWWNSLRDLKYWFI